MSLAHQIAPNGIAARALAASGLSIEIIRVDGGTQSRALLQDSVIEEYAAAIRAGISFPAIVVFYDGNDHWLADGFHRVRAFAAAGKDRIPADVRQGTRRDAILFSVGANETHGLRRTNDDKRRAVQTLLNDAEWAQWSDREIARVCRVDHKFVGKLRPAVTGDVPSERTYTTKHGTVATMNTSAIGRTSHDENKKEPALEEPAKTAASRKNGIAMYLPEGKGIVELCRHGLELEAKGEMTVEQIAAELGLASNAYRISRQIVLLADNEDLSASDKALAAKAVSHLVETRQWATAWEMAEPLATKVWGEGRRDNLRLIAERRNEQFERSFGILLQTCMTTDEVDLPYLTADRVAKALRQIGQARGALQRFADRIKDIHE